MGDITKAQGAAKREDKRRGMDTMQLAEFKRIRHLAALKSWDKRGRKHVGGGANPEQSRGDFRGDTARRFSEKEGVLRNTPQREAEILGGGISPSYKVKLQSGEKGCFKPSDGERGGVRRGIEQGQMAEREAGAWEVAKLVGMDDMVAPTVIRECDVPEYHHGFSVFPGGKVRGSFAQWQVGDVAKGVAGDRKYDGDEDLQRAAMFDYIIGNTDRHHGNWVVDRNSGKLKLIDHGLAFPEKTAEEGGSYGNREFLERVDIPRFNVQSTAKYAEPYFKKKREILSALSKLGLPAAAIERVGRRIDLAYSATSWNDITRSRADGRQRSGGVTAPPPPVIRRDSRGNPIFDQDQSPNDALVAALLRRGR